ncbi:SusC/RagA family TonB-linked outer membrane protein [Flavivirga jejuensis]|uniref:SusC/RagA family TonB-linked outer membrane protein n=1 Tax=Flavivirga jejuensis TaxID=870487 RepID=A0ABT8WN34_9FLAO|nr:SusC/RagA family TonB-linked outer membrane protein [Flavivirga jejuensis]MDO5974566.1 SusC/RagA family TonB-linked outer membrane protein [Flavivirga jejuensis]
MKKIRFKEIRTRVLFLVLTFACLGAYAQERVLTGTVQDNMGTPLTGANILQVGTNNGTQADFDGTFSIMIAGGNAQLEISYIGFTTKIVQVGDQNTLTIVMEEDAQGLDEIILVGYGTAKKRDITGAVERVTLEDSPVALTSNTSIYQSVRGATAGVNIGAQNTAGGTPSISIRGQNSIDGNNEPLIVLDGIIFLGNVNDINPNDIASIDILKDASASVVYGSRAANGVLLINTKKGKTDKPVINFSSSTGFNTWQNKQELMGRDRYLNKYIAQQNFATVDDIVWEEEYRDVLQDEGVDTDWLDLISRTGQIQKHNISVSGRSDKFNYFFSGSYEDHEGVVLGDDYNRITVRSRLQTDITDWLEVGIDGSYTNSDFSGVEAGVVEAIRMAPIGYPYRYDGQPFNTASNTSTDLERYPTGNNVESPLWGTDGTADDFDVRNYFRLAANATVRIPWVKGLKYTLNYTLSQQNRRRDQFEYESHFIALPVQGTPYFDRYSQESLQANLSQANGRNRRYTDRNYVIDNIINYNNTFGNHNIDVTLVATRDYRFQDESSLTGSDFAAFGNTNLGVNGVHFATETTTDYDVVERSNIGYLGRLSYGFDNKYNLTASIRRDGASVFGEDIRWGTFWSIGGAWTLSEENFLKDNEILNYLKINASYGVLGNQGIKEFNYQTLSQVSAGEPGNIRYAFGDNPSESQFGIAQGNIGNSKLGWEGSDAFNFGLHAAFLNNRISLDANAYYSKTRDQLFTRNIPTTSGFSTILTSLGQIDNKGLEISLSTVNVETKDFNWTSTLTYWLNRSEIVELYGDDIDGDGVEDDDEGNSYFIGKPLGAQYGLEYIGVVQADDTQYMTDNPGAEPGDPMFRDVDGVAGITGDDRKIVGYNTPRFRMGLANTLQYKNFTLYALVNGTFGGGKDNYFIGKNPRYNSLQSRSDFNEIENGDWWTPENESTTNLRPNFDEDGYDGYQSRGFVRVQNVNLSYQFDQNIFDSLNLGIKSLSVYVNADNPLLFTDWFGGGDPERGIAAYADTPPVMSAYTFGVNLSF